MRASKVNRPRNSKKKNYTSPISPIALSFQAAGKPIGSVLGWNRGNSRFHVVTFCFRTRLMMNKWWR